jgi:hypothetical protein
MVALLRSIAMAALAAGCSSVESVGEPIPVARLPTAAELKAYVAEHWSTYSLQLANEAGDRPTLQDVNHVDCGYPFGISNLLDCTFEATIVFSNGQTRTKRLERRFERDAAGNLMETMVIIHPITRAR